MVLELKAAEAWKCLRGLICVYKPPDVKVAHVRRTIITKLCTGI